MFIEIVLFRYKRQNMAAELKVPAEQIQHINSAFSAKALTFFASWKKLHRVPNAEGSDTTGDAPSIQLDRHEVQNAG